MKWHFDKRAIRVSAVSFCFVVLLLICFSGQVAALVSPPLERVRARKILSQAKTPEELRVAVGYLGASYTLPDGSWVAIRYKDSHAAPGYSCAVAYDSKGHWLYSSRHFCGRFRSYSQIQQQMEPLAQAGDNEVTEILRGVDSEMFRLSTATNLHAAREQLRVMGFKNDD